MTTTTAATNFVNNIADHLSARGYTVLRESVDSPRADEDKWALTFFVAARGNDDDVARFTLNLVGEGDAQGMSAVVDAKASQVRFKQNGLFTYDSKDVDTTAAKMALTQGLIAVTGTYGPGVAASGDMANIIVETMEMAGLAAKD